MNTFFKGQSRDKRLRGMPLKYNVDLSYILYINCERVMSPYFIFIFIPISGSLCRLP